MDDDFWKAYWQEMAWPQVDRALGLIGPRQELALLELDDGRLGAFFRKTRRARLPS